jgi:uncharacterized Tic20 family protein
MMNTSPTSEDRTWAVLSHLSSLAFGMGIVLPIVGWSEQRRKSNYGSFQNLQALGYQSLGFTVWILTYLVIVIVGLFVLLIWPGSSRGISERPNVLSDPGLIFFMVVIFVLFALYFILPIIAAVACALGKDFRYPLLGDRLARYVGYNPVPTPDEQAWLIEDHEFRWVAAMGHFSILIMLWGMLAPLTAWVIYGKQNFFLKFQSIQTLVYQAVVTILYFIGTTLYLGGLFGLLASMEGIGQASSDSSLGIVGMAISGVLLLLGGLVILAVPLFHILGQWAGYRVLTGDDYHYPLIGRLIEKRIGKQSVND